VILAEAHGLERYTSESSRVQYLANVCSVVPSGASCTITRVSEMPQDRLVHPSASRRSVIWWAGHHGGPALPDLDREVVGTVAMAQGLVALNPGFVAEVRGNRGLGLMLEGEAWKAQLHPDHPLRTTSFEALPWVEAGLRHEPERWSAAQSEDFVEAFVDEQVRHATLLTTPAHYEADPVGPVHRRDVELAEMAAEHVRAKALREPAEDDELRMRRELYANIHLRVGRVDAAERRWLVDAYKSIDVDGYVIWAVSFTGSQAQVQRLLALVDELVAAAGRPVVVAGVGHFWQLMLSRGVAAAVHGRRTALAWLTDALDPMQPEPDAEDDFGVAVYHGAILGCIQTGKRSDVDRRRLFFRHPCGCGHHTRGAAPEGQKATLAHNLWWSMHEACQVCLQGVERATLVLALRAAAAKTNREGLGLAELRTGWRTLADARAREGQRDIDEA
jgi:hypothetical protein